MIPDRKLDTGAELGADLVRAHLVAILSSSGFSNADRLSRFLEYTVEMKLRGEEDQIKEFLLGREVFDRGGDYDPRMDPIVRVEARRLRQRLAEYYAGPGKTEAIRIEYPKGSYAPVIQHRASVAPVSEGTARRNWLGIGLVFAAGVAVAGALYQFRERQPIAVIPAEWIGDEGAAPGSDNLAEAITAEMVKRGGRPVVGWPVVAGLGKPSRDPRALARELGVREVLLVSVRSDADRIRVTAFLIEADTGQKRWVGEFFPNPLSDPAARNDVAAEIAAAIPR